MYRLLMISIFPGLLLLVGCNNPGATGRTVVVNDDNFEAVVLQSDKPVLVDFWAEWCGPCQAIAPVVTELAEEFAGQAVVAKVDVDVAMSIAQRYAVSSIPTLIVFSQGEEVDRVVGLKGKNELAALLQRAM